MTDTQLKPLEVDKLEHENGLDAQRLLPFPGLLAPFEGSWCVIRPGTASTPHAHHEHELFIALAGEAVIDRDDYRFPFVAGDSVRFTPGQRHSVINDSDQDFTMYSIWWDNAMSERFLENNVEDGTLS